jgi:hypothetical protein
MQRLAAKLLIALTNYLIYKFSNQMRHGFYEFFLWWAVISLGLWVGGTLFHILVVQPLWTDNPPLSVKFFFTQTKFNETVWNFFGPPWMAARLLPLLLCILLGWNNQGRQRIYLIVAGVCWLFITVYTLAYVYSINEILFKHAGENHSAEYVQELVKKWLFADRFRFLIGIVGYICLLIVFRNQV